MHLKSEYQEGEELLKLKDNICKGSNLHKMVRNKFGPEIRKKVSKHYRSEFMEWSSKQSSRGKEPELYKFMEETI